MTKEEKAVKPMFVFVGQQNILNHGDIRECMNERSS